MKVSGLKFVGPAFGRRLDSEEMSEYKKTFSEARNLCGQTGDSVLIVHDACLPQCETKNYGVANLSGEDSVRFFEDMKNYLGVNTVEVLPQNSYYGKNNFYCAYTGSAFSLGKYQINPYLLASEKYGNLLRLNEIDEVVKSNKIPDKDLRVNYSNVLDVDSPFDEILRIAYARFKKLDKKTPLYQEFESYTKDNKDWLEPKSIYNVLGHKYSNSNFEEWNSEIDKNLYNPEFAIDGRDARITQILSENSEEVRFFNFTQFMAEKHLAEGKSSLNKLGLDLKGDCLINFSADEIWANPQAFKKDYFIGNAEWCIKSLDYEAAKDSNSPAAKLLARKVELFARRYDSIRFDVGWSYVRPSMTNKAGRSIHPYLGDNVLKLIETTVKKVKGEDYDLSKLVYEFEANPVDFPIFKANSSELIDPLKTRTKVYGSTYMHDNSFYDRWGSYEIFTKHFGWNPDSLLYGIGNHDPQPLRQIAEGMPDICQQGQPIYKDGAIKVLSEFFHIPVEALQDPVEFTKAKWAETMQAKNKYVFYMDVFGEKERFDMQGLNISVHPENNYAYKIPFDYMKKYIDAIRNGFGFNPMDAFARLFVKKGFDKSNPELYAKILKFRDILLEEEASHKVSVAGNSTSDISQIKDSKNKFLITIACLATVGTGLYTIFAQRGEQNGTNLNTNA